jgi:hypothetical protein
LDSAKARYDSKTAKLQKECNDKLSALEQSFNESVQLLVDMYDKYMEEFAPAKQYLPTVVNIRIPEKEIYLRNVSISRTDSTVDIKNIIQRRLAEDGNPIYNWGKTVFSIRSCVQIVFNTNWQNVNNSITVLLPRLINLLKMTKLLSLMKTGWFFVFALFSC